MCPLRVQDSKVVWVGEQRLLTSGFSADRSRELTLRDTRQLAKPQHTLSLDVSSGILVPLYDPDTNMIFLSGECSFIARQVKLYTFWARAVNCSINRIGVR